MSEDSKTNVVQTFRSEMRKIHWPSKEEIVKYTTTVIGVSILVSLVIFAFDQVFSRALGLLLK